MKGQSILISFESEERCEKLMSERKEGGRGKEREKKRETKPVGGSQVIYSGYT